MGTQTGNLSRTRSLVESQSSGQQLMAHGSITMSTDTETITVPGMTKITGLAISQDGDPAAGLGDHAFTTGAIPDQTQVANAGKIQLKAWQDDFTTATSNFLKVNWVAFGE